MRYLVTWERQGAVRWQEWWIKQNGPTRTHIPGLDEHISFVNFDLRRLGYPSLSREVTGDLYITLPDEPMHRDNMLRASEILENHGFKLHQSS